MGIEPLRVALERDDGYDSQLLQLSGFSATLLLWAFSVTPEKQLLEFILPFRGLGPHLPRHASHNY
jgi:hypothetical protein